MPAVVTPEGQVVRDDLLDEQFVGELTAAQGPLLAYISCLLGNVHDASTVLQETNLVIWRKSKEFSRIGSFIAWSREIAYFQTLAFLRDRKRDKLVFSQDVINAIAAKRDEVDFDERRLALRDCVSQLLGHKRELIEKRYVESKQIWQIASDLQRTEGAIKMSLKRIRVSLMECINRRLEAAR
jgi:RNA polymerase sigma-70 factor (ECF subfamily)